MTISLTVRPDFLPVSSVNLEDFMCGERHHLLGRPTFIVRVWVNAVEFWRQAILGLSIGTR